MSTDIDSVPQPTTLARKPPTSEALWSNIRLCAGCFVIAAIGAGIWWLSPNAIADTWQTQSNAFLIMLASPLMLLAGCYFLYTSVRDWRFLKAFNRHKQTLQGVITHLWRGKDDAQRTAYFVGYAYGEHRAYQAVNKRQFDILTVGKEVRVIFLTTDPSVSTLEPIQRTAKRKKNTPNALA